MNREFLQYLILIILVLIIIVLNVKNNTVSIDGFVDNGDDKLNDLKSAIDDLQTARNSLETALKTEPLKANYKKTYYDNIVLNLDKKLEDEMKLLENKKVSSELDKLQDTYSYINTLLNFEINTKKFNSVKSLQNGSKIAIIPVPSKNNKKYYLIKVNTSKYKSGYITTKDDGTIDLVAKVINDNNSYDDKQLFEIVNINNKTDYENILDKGLLINKFYDKNAIVYPFALLKSKYNKNCLQSFDNNLSLMTCKPFKSHRFKPQEESIMCKNKNPFFF